MKKQFFILGLGFLIGTCSVFGYSNGDYYSPYAPYYPYRANINQYRYYSHNPQYTHTTIRDVLIVGEATILPTIHKGIILIQQVFPP